MGYFRRFRKPQHLTGSSKNLEGESGEMLFKFLFVLCTRLIVFIATNIFLPTTYNTCV